MKMVSCLAMAAREVRIHESRRGVRVTSNGDRAARQTKYSPALLAYEAQEGLSRKPEESV